MAEYLADTQEEETDFSVSSVFFPFIFCILFLCRLYCDILAHLIIPIWSSISLTLYLSVSYCISFSTYFPLSVLLSHFSFSLSLLRCCFSLFTTSCLSFSITLSPAILSQASSPYLSFLLKCKKRNISFLGIFPSFLSHFLPPTFCLPFVSVSHWHFSTCHPLFLSFLLCPAFPLWLSISISLSLVLWAALNQFFESVWAARPKWFSITAAC